MKIYENQRFGEERALYGENNIQVLRCQFKGEEDGESALKECKNINVDQSQFDLRYPLWHVTNATISQSHMSEGCRAAMWYDKNLQLTNCKLEGIKALRECKQINIENTQINSQEFGWLCKDITMKNCQLTSEYPFMKTKQMYIDHLKMKGKYSFQYTKDIEIHNSNLDTKDAFWHSDNVTVYDSTLKGEYLAWYSKNLKLINCKIIGTQPFCYCENLELINCEMIDCDLSFEKSSVHADIKGEIMSIKNPKSGSICADSYGKIILETPTTCEIKQR